MHNNIPFIIGVTGHRDIRHDCIEFIKKELNFFFSELKTSLPNTPIYLMSPLAEGADRLAAEIALSYGISLIAPLPMEKDEYLNSFKNEQSRQDFAALLAKSTQNYFIGYADKNRTENSIDTSAQYQKVGEHIADQCNFLIALWDQKLIDKIGGTSQIVTYKRKGFEDNLFDDLDGNAIQVIPVIREGSDAVLPKKPGTLEPEILGQKVDTQVEFNELLQNIDSVNLTLAEHSKKSDDKTNHYESMSNRFSTIATYFQVNFKRSIIILLLLSWIAVLSLELLHNFHLMNSMYVYAAVILGAFSYFYLKIKKQRHQDFFILFRGLSEALRVQNYWMQSGIDSSVAKYYLKRHFSDITWMKIALKNIYTQNKFIFMCKQEENIDKVKHEWIDGQVDYFTKAIAERQQKYHILEKREKRFYMVGMILSSITFFLFLWLTYLPQIGLSKDQLKFIFHLALFTSGMSLVTAAFIGEKYLHITGYKEEINNFEIMQTIFTKAKSLLESKEIDSKHILKELGKEALNENSHWVVLHYDRKFNKPIIE